MQQGQRSDKSPSSLRWLCLLPYASGPGCCWVEVNAYIELPMWSAFSCFCRCADAPMANFSPASPMEHSRHRKLFIEFWADVDFFSLEALVFTNPLFTRKFFINPDGCSLYVLVSSLSMAIHLPLKMFFIATTLFPEFSPRRLWWRLLLFRTANFFFYWRSAIRSSFVCFSSDCCVLLNVRVRFYEDCYFMIFYLLTWCFITDLAFLLISAVLTTKHSCILPRTLHNCSKTFKLLL